MVKARDTIKVWWVLYVCQATGAARAFLAPGYDTASFLLAHDKFLSLSGKPQTITSDRGSQLRKASRVVNFTDSKDPANWDWDAIENAGSRDGTQWVFIPPGSQ